MVILARVEQWCDAGNVKARWCESWRRSTHPPPPQKKKKPWMARFNTCTNSHQQGTYF